MANIEQNLREIAKAKGLRLSDIADRMGTTVSNLLSSVKRNPTVSKLEDIANALGIGVSELLTLRPEPAQGLIVIDGKTWQIAKPSNAMVQIPAYSRYDVLRGDIRVFVAKAAESGSGACMMGVVETMEYFCLLHDPCNEMFHLSLCYADGKTMTIPYDKMEYCAWKKEKSADIAVWNVEQVTEEIINDLEGAVPARLIDREDEENDLNIKK